jgi:LacI family transcriptional regulator
VHIHSAKWGHRRAAELTREMMQGANPPDGIFCQNDLMARGAIAALHEMGHAVPDDVAVIGYDDREFARDMVPSLSTITNPHAEMAEAALERLCSAEPLSQGRRDYPGTLVVRDSTRRAATSNR